jgi:hypothetical protein
MSAASREWYSRPFAKSSPLNRWARHPIRPSRATRRAPLPRPLSSSKGAHLPSAGGPGAGIRRTENCRYKASAACASQPGLSVVTIREDIKAAQRPQCGVGACPRSSTASRQWPARPSVRPAHRLVRVDQRPQPDGPGRSVMAARSSEGPTKGTSAVGRSADGTVGTWAIV